MSSPLSKFDVVLELIEAARKQERKLAAVEELVHHARLVSAGPRAIIYVTDLEVALGLATELAPSRLGANGAADPSEVPHEH